MDWMIRCSNSGKSFTYVLMPNQLPTQLTSATFPGVKPPGLELTTHLHLVYRSRISGAMPLFLYTPSRRRKDNFTFTFTLVQKTIKYHRPFPSHLPDSHICYDIPYIRTDYGFLFLTVGSSLVATFRRDILLPSSALNCKHTDGCSN